MCDFIYTDDCHDCEECEHDHDDGLGDCYLVHGSHMLRHKADLNPHLMLVHGEVIGQGNLSGVPYGHCWLEDSKLGMVIDLSNQKVLKMPIDQYYDLGNIDTVSENKLLKYTLEEVREKILEYEHWGPWELECER